MEETEDFAKKVAAEGPKMVVVTRGAEKAVIYAENRFFYQESAPAKVIDTLGAGDSFIARLLVGVLKKESLGKALNMAAQAAADARSCFHFRLGSRTRAGSDGS